VKPSELGEGKGPSPMRYAGLGLQLAVSLLLFVWIGQWADRKLGTGGLITILAALVGFGGTMFSVIRRLNRENKEE
jgi:F0F1-type ATP synthase assembly protein I